MFAIKPSLLSTRCKVPRKNEKHYIPQSSKKHEIIAPLLKQAIDAANETCLSPDAKDIECSVKWDEVHELTKAYRNAVEQQKESRESQENQEEMTVLEPPFNYPPIKNPNSWDVLL